MIYSIILRQPLLSRIQRINLYSGVYSSMIARTGHTGAQYPQVRQI